MNEKECDLYAAIHNEQARSERETLPPDPSYFDDFITRFEEGYKKEESPSQNKPVDLFVKDGGSEKFSEGRKTETGRAKKEAKPSEKRSEAERKKKRG